MSRKRRPLPPTKRVTALSAQAALGPWVRSDRVNTRPESNWLANFVPILVLAVVGIAVVPFLSAIPWGGRALIVAACVAFAVIGVHGTRQGLEQHRRGHWLVHRFDDGFVMERTRGRLLAMRYDDLDAELMTYHEPGDSTSAGIDYVLLRLTDRDGGVWVMSEASFDAPDALVELGERCGAGAPDPVDYRSAIGLREAHVWA